jgi:hypothetical protein
VAQPAPQNPPEDQAAAARRIGELLDRIMAADSLQEVFPAGHSKLLNLAKAAAGASEGQQQQAQQQAHDQQQQDQQWQQGQEEEGEEQQQQEQPDGLAMLAGAAADLPVAGLVADAGNNLLLQAVDLQQQLKEGVEEEAVLRLCLLHWFALQQLTAKEGPDSAAAAAANQAIAEVQQQQQQHLQQQQQPLQAGVWAKVEALLLILPGTQEQDVSRLYEEVAAALGIGFLCSDQDSDSYVMFRSLVDALRAAYLAKPLAVAG